jgi:hypothetical protein
MAALWAFWPRRYGAIQLLALRKRYLAAEPEFAQLRLLDTQITTIEELAATLYRKGRRASSYRCRSSRLGRFSSLLDQSYTEAGGAWWRKSQRSRNKGIRPNRARTRPLHPSSLTMT